MPTVRFRGQRIECERDTVLRDVLLDADSSPHNGTSRHLNCRGRAACGTCAVEVSGPVSEMDDDERKRLSLPPHGIESGLRLSCRTKVRDNVEVVKHSGFWGQRVEQDDEGDAGDAGSDSVESEGEK
ncbi:MULTISPECIES: 2Fe-2S iron-sulfur cluster-binding protein [Halorussus]|uniref:2Fe-2S iron-sulfur cluster-binding protein n=1 Tax=Halorussus TaxID=1070314 RepID=UPI00209F2A45|nr:2Fe-2S iron-sulfur cluster binding domain-containing protein [Halorussus vallis]USZ77024.1 2Fe-2S iron-sulfur cluster binding domain-containing protein [Halorussus vallis]